MSNVLPIFDNRTIIGHAKSEAGAARALRALGIKPVRGFAVQVWRRSEFTQELLGLPDGFVYVIGHASLK